MRYLHTMVRIRDIEQSLKFYCDGLGLTEIRRVENEKGRFTDIFLAAPADKSRALSEKAPMLELTYNWDALGVTINRPSRDDHMAFARSPDLVSIELLQKGDGMAPKEPWASMSNTGIW